MSIQHVLIGAMIAGAAGAGVATAHNEQRPVAIERVAPCGMQPLGAAYCVDTKALARAMGKSQAPESQSTRIEQLEAQIVSLEGQIAILQMRR